MCHTHTCTHAYVHTCTHTAEFITLSSHLHDEPSKCYGACINPPAPLPSAGRRRQEAEGAGPANPRCAARHLSPTSWESGAEERKARRYPRSFYPSTATRRPSMWDNLSGIKIAPEASGLPQRGLPLGLVVVNTEVLDQVLL